MTELQKKAVKTYIMGYDLDEYSYDYLYRKIYKIPVRIYFEGLIDTFTFKITVDDLKEITREIIEDSTGFELTFTDKDWDDLKMEEKEEKRIIWGKEDISIIKELNTNKVYMLEFFEL